MGEDVDIGIGALRSQVAALVEQEGALLAQALDLSRSGAGARAVDALFARVQAIQVQRKGVEKQIASLLGSQRLHVASEVWRPGIYDYRAQVGRDSVRVRVGEGPLGLQVLFPGRADAVRIGSLEGTFDGPLTGDEAQAPRKRAARKDPA